MAAQLTSHLTDSPCARNSLYSDQRLVKHSIAVISGEGLPQVKGLIAGFSPRSPGFTTRTIHVGLMLHTVSLEQVSPINNNSNNSPHPLYVMMVMHNGATRGRTSTDVVSRHQYKKKSKKIK